MTVIVVLHPAQQDYRRRRMKFNDALYGRFEIGDWLRPVLLSPEVQRLSQVRLLNCPSPTFAALGEVRRYSHTIGVLHLATLVDLRRFHDSVKRAFFVSVLLHDLGTPPFGHLLEYHLQEHSKGKWHHEKMPKAVLDATHAPEGKEHQFFSNRITGLRQAVLSCGVDVNEVVAICSGSHELSSLLFGSLDLDNIDNVFRMALMLGLDFDRSTPQRLAKLITPATIGMLSLSEAQGKELVDVWADLRLRVYEILNLSGMAVAYQSVLSQAIESLVQQGLIAEPSWVLTDDQLFAAATENAQTKRKFMWEFFESPPKVALKAFIDLPFRRFGVETRADLNKIVLNAFVSASGGGARAAARGKRPGTSTDVDPRAYSVIDRGTFSKALSFVQPETGTVWTHGNRSDRVIIYVFVRADSAMPKFDAAEFFLQLARATGIEASELVAALRPFPEDSDDQSVIPAI